MIDKTKLTQVWIKEVSEKNNDADKILIDRVLHALLLLEGLSKQNIDFIFKGGTALMLLLGTAKRLSIDIDIILRRHTDNIENNFNDLIKEQGFIRFELQERSKSSKIDKEHYKFYYTPLIKTTSDEDYILLDILYEENKYSNNNKIQIKSTFVPSTGDSFEVKIPSLEDLLGDKLTAFAPNTTGIPYYKKDVSMSMEIIKQLYDIGNLFDEVQEINIIKLTFNKIAKTELAYRGLKTISGKDVLEDIYQTSLCLVMRGSDGKGDFDLLQSGINRIRQFIFSENYHLDKAIISASKAAYLSKLIKYDEIIIDKFINSEQLNDLTIEEPFNTKLNKLKKSNPEAFFYWYKVYELDSRGKNG